MEGGRVGVAACGMDEEEDVTWRLKEDREESVDDRNGKAHDASAGVRTDQWKWIFGGVEGEEEEEEEGGR